MKFYGETAIFWNPNVIAGSLKYQAVIILENFLFVARFRSRRHLIPRTRNTPICTVLNLIYGASIGSTAFGISVILYRKTEITMNQIKALIALLVRRAGPSFFTTNRSPLPSTQRSQLGWALRTVADHKNFWTVLPRTNKYKSFFQSPAHPPVKRYAYPRRTKTAGRTQWLT